MHNSAVSALIESRIIILTNLLLLFTMIMVVNKDIPFHKYYTLCILLYIFFFYYVGFWQYLTSFLFFLTTIWVCIYAIGMSIHEMESENWLSYKPQNDIEQFGVGSIKRILYFSEDFFYQNCAYLCAAFFTLTASFADCNLFWFRIFAIINVITSMKETLSVTAMVLDKMWLHQI